jgi:hypothetical protein
MLISAGFTAASPVGQENVHGKKRMRGENGHGMARKASGSKAWKYERVGASLPSSLDAAQMRFKGRICQICSN